MTGTSRESRDGCALRPYSMAYRYTVRPVLRNIRRTALSGIPVVYAFREDRMICEV